MAGYSAEGGSYAKVSNGRLFYRRYGDANGPVLVLVHGLTTPSFVWRDMLPDLVAAGFHILTFDHFGRGFSSYPKQPQTLDFFIQELQELLDSLNINTPVHLLGYSMGGGIVAAFAARHPARVNRLVMLAPAGFRAELGGFFDWAARTPLLGDLAMRLFGGRLFRQGSEASIQQEGADPEMVAMQCAETRNSGFAAAVLSSMRNVTSKNLHSEHARIADQKTPSLAIFAADDTIIPISSAKGLSAANANAKIVIVPDSGHCLAYTHSGTVNKAVLEFLNRA